MSNRIREGQKAVQAVRNKINNKFFKEKVSVSMFQTDSDKDAKAMDNLKIGEEFKDRNGTTWTRNEEGQIENDPLAGSNLDQRDLDEQARQFAQGGGKPQENPPATRNKARNEVGPDKRMTGLPAEAGNQNVDSRTERRVG